MKLSQLLGVGRSTSYDISDVVKLENELEALKAERHRLLTADEHPLPSDIVARARVIITELEAINVPNVFAKHQHVAGNAFTLLRDLIVAAETRHNVIT